jgi:halogenation protein CepH
MKQINCLRGCRQQLTDARPKDRSGYYMKSAMQDFDLAVVGGGPAGSSVATFVAMRGHRVVLLEKETFPRHQIGESLLPATVHGICPLLGVSEEIKKAGFMRKLGGTFRWGRNAEPWTFNFGSSPMMDVPTGFAYQVERSRFDNILLQNARTKGVDVRERTLVTDIVRDGDGVVTGLRVIDEVGHTHAITARYVADASGNTSRVYKAVGQRVYSKLFRNVALYGYYTGGKRLPSPNGGNILSAAFEGGWFWYIPLTHTLTSVGAVVDREHAKGIRGHEEEAMQGFIDACPIVKDFLADASRVTEGQYGKLRIRTDYSYSNTSLWSPGMVLVGDAACFVDPVFSSGVHLATYGALLAARSINSCLRGEMAEERAFQEFEMRYRREFSHFYRFLAAFYDLDQDEDSYFWTARKVLNSEEPANQAFVRLVAGVGLSGEPLFGSVEQLLDATRSVSNSFERAQSVRGEFDQSLLDAEFMTGLTREAVQMQMHALTGEAQVQAPIQHGGLVPSPDGLLWREGAA